MQKRLLQLARDARTAEEEQGINILFLAMGFLTWFEDKNSDVKREAPLILLPVELVRNLRTSTYDLRCRDEDKSLPLGRFKKAKSNISNMTLPAAVVIERYTAKTEKKARPLALMRWETWWR